MLTKIALNRNLGRYILITLLTIMTPSCLVTEAFSVPKSWDWAWWKAKPYLTRGLPDGDGEYSQGFQAGCKFELAAVSIGGLRVVKFKVDGWKINKSNLYYAGFNDGTEHCAYIYDWDIT